MSAMLVHIQVTCFSKNYMQKRVCSYNWCQFTAEKYGFWARTIHSFIWSRQVVQIPLSDYAKRLDGKVRERYLKKILKIGIDPALLVGKPFEPDCLPPVEWTDLLCYLVPETSFYTQKQLKTFCSQASGLQSNGFGVCFQRARTYHRKRVCRVGKSAALAANEGGLNPNNCLQDVISMKPSVKSHLWSYCHLRSLIEW